MHSELTDILARIRTAMPIASDAAISAVLARHPKSVQIIHLPHSTGIDEGLFAYLPLNIAGHARLLDGTLKTNAPEPELICGPSEVPSALYIWLVFAPGRLGRAIGLLADLLDEAAPMPCPVYSRAVNLHAAQLNDSLGFNAVQPSTLECPSDLLVILPTQAAVMPNSARPSVHIVRDLGDFSKIITVRAATYVAEQFCHFDEEFDGNDLCATHWLGVIDGDAAGCIRARFFQGFAKIERLAVRREYRKSRLAFQLVRAAIDHCQRKGYTRLYGHSRLDLIPFWRVFGFREMMDRPSLSFADIRYAEMIFEGKAPKNAISLESDAMKILRPEGAWDEAGPFDCPPIRSRPDRRGLIECFTRRVGNQSIVGQL
jgi:predicted GNAT family N-acyltransferase